MNRVNTSSSVMPDFNRSLVWFRRDLRLSDHTALSEACARSQFVIPVFIFDTSILNRLRRDDRRMSFIHRSLREMEESLSRSGSHIVVLRGNPVNEIPMIAKTLRAQAVFVNEDSEPYAKMRDHAVAERLAADGRLFFSFKDQVVFHRNEILTNAGTPFQVYTPYRKAWLAHFDEQMRSGDYPVRERVIDRTKFLREDLPSTYRLPQSVRELSFDERTLWIDAGENAARRRLHDFLNRLDEYDTCRDYPFLSGTSGLSVHLRFGTLSIRELIRNVKERTSRGAQTWLSELIWREFYQMILDHFPHVAEASFKTKYDALRWPGSDKHFLAWCEGKTGYPIVDAAMRHFNETGWMHNRLRMIVASFLTKDLLIDWRMGEEYFAEQLLDFDLAANNGGWQWCASTGCDAQPYFRIFNPVLQSKKFDPDGKFIRMHCPELKNFPRERIHWPHDSDISEQRAAGCILGKDYPNPIVNHTEQKEKVLSLFRSVRSESASLR